MPSDLGRAALRHCAEMLAPLAALADPDGLTNLLSELGWDGQALGITDPSVFAAVVNALETTLDAISLALAQENVELADLVQALEPLGAAAASTVQAVTSLSLPPGVPADASTKLGEDLLNYLFTKHLVSCFPRIAVAASLLGVLTATETAPVTSAGGQVLRQPTTQYVIDMAAVGKALADPLGYARANLLLDSSGVRRAAEAIADLIGPDVATALGWVGLGAGYGVIPPDPTVTLTQAEQDAAKHLMLIAASLPTGTLGALAVLSVALGLTDDTNQQGLGLLVAVSGDVSLSTTLVNGTVTVTVGGALEPLVITGESVRLASGTSGPVTLSVEVKYASTAQPAVRFGSPSGTGLQIDSLQAGAGVAEDGGTVDVTGSIDLNGVALTVRGGDGDGFLAEVLPQDPVELRGDLGLQFSLRTGLKVRGSGALEWHAAIHKSIGPIELTDIAADVVLSSDTLRVEVTATLGIALGPVSATIDGIGIAAKLQQAAAAGSGPAAGNAGPYSLTVGFQPPDGIALALDAAPVSGVGFIAFDEADARYLGALALAVGDVSISAVGVLDTRLPGGAHGYSLVVVASATFPPVQLGFGFSLDGLGGLVGVNRTADVPSLQAAARAGQLDDLMFPADLIHRAPQVAANLAREFPAAQGHFIIGPAVRLAWGADGMVEAEVGVFIELSDVGGGISLLRVALLGVVHLALPEAVDPVADLTLDVLGIVDLAAKTLSLDAGLRNSTIAGFPLTGQAALRAGWGADPEFVFAIGGFNPHFAAPAGFPALQRVTLSIADSDAQLTLSAYLALTSNTLQLGCAANLNASAGSAAVTASLSFDALVQFKPFGLIIDLSIAATVLLNGNAIMTLDLDLHLTGPRPWVVTGEASFHVLFCSFSVPVAITVGPQPPPASPVTVDLDGNLTAALAAPGSWQTGPPPGQGLVKVRAQDKAHPAVHPLGSLTVRQHAVPLGQRVERYGPDLLDAACRYEVTGAQLGGRPAQRTGVKDFFAPAQFLTMTDADKLSAPSFEQMIAGATLGSTALTVAAMPGSTQGTTVVVDTPSTKTWNMLILDSPNPVTTTGVTAADRAATSAAPVLSSSQQVTLPGTMLAAQLPGAAAAVNGTSGRGQALYTRPGMGNGITVQQPVYAIAGMNLAPPLGTARTDQLRIPTAAAAPSTIDAGQRGQDWQVVYASEMAGS